MNLDARSFNSDQREKEYTMKKFIKFFLITLASLLLAIIITFSVVSWIVFTPERITPIVRKQTEKRITCPSEIGEVELTFFSTFPHLGLKVDHFLLMNPVSGASVDTLMYVERLVGVIDAAAWWKNEELILTGITLSGGTIHAITDSLGNSNFNIMAPDKTDTKKDRPGMTLSLVDISSIELKNINLSYQNLSSQINTAIQNLNAKIAGRISGDSISCDIKVSKSGIFFEHEGEVYLDHASVRLDIPADVIQSRQFIRLKGATASVNDLKIWLNGTIENDTVNRNIITDISYKLEAWPVQNTLALVPPIFNSYIKDIEARGLLSSGGTIKGFLSDSVMPVMDIHVLLEQGMLKYSGFPLPLHDIDADINFLSDLKDDALSFIRINRLYAKTPESSIKSTGMVDRLFSDVYCRLRTNASVTLEEWESLMPGNMNMNFNGKVQARILSDFSLPQLQNLQLEKMKLSGSMILSDVDFKYDSLWLKTNRSAIEFALPNDHASTGKTKFSFASLTTDNLEAGKTGNYHAMLLDAQITLEASDVRDTSRMPDIICSFAMDTLAADMDTIGIAVARPYGKIEISTDHIKTGQPGISISYNSDKLETNFGQNSAAMKKINIDADIINDKTQQDIFLQWMAKGFIDMEQGTVTLSALPEPVEIPAIKMEFEPETFGIKESSMRIGQSDFQLSGTLNNVLSYFRGDSILRGDFSFVSDKTDVWQIMRLTSGLGQQDTAVVEKQEESDQDSIYKGPYIVPKGMDILLSTSIRQATLDLDTATNIKGDVRVRDGILLLDKLTFETPAARMQLTAVYRTPRKNHLFLGLDYHMLDVEIGELLTMIPDIDTLMPMLRSFGGEAEFHLTVESYLDSLYNLKKSTLRGASSIKGQNLVLMDGETFSEIAKKLRFNKKTENKVDSLSAEFTIFREEIDVYPFLIVMDKYKAVVGGRHNFDMTFDYNITVVESPLPFRLGVDVKGDLDDISAKLAKSKYPEFYRPDSRRVVENKQLELRKMIRDFLTQKVED